MDKPKWCGGPLKPQLERHQVHIWRANLHQDAKRRKHFATNLSASELQRADRFVFDTDRHHFIVAHGILREILSRYLNISPHELDFCYGVHGKPSLIASQNPHRVQFNLSHSAEIAVYAVTLQDLIGIDVEYRKEGRELINIAKRYFSAQEVRMLLALPKEQQNIGFYNAWTRKEAFIKALGEGMHFPLSDFKVSLTPGEPAQLLAIKGNPLLANSWSMISFTPAAEYQAAAVKSGNIHGMNYWDIYQ